MFIVITRDGQSHTFEKRPEMLDWLIDESGPAEVERILEAEDIRLDACERAFDLWWDAWVTLKGPDANNAISSDAPDFLGEIMGAIWLERRISDKCAESGK